MIVVDDPLGAAHDPALPSLRLALDPYEVKRRFKRRLPRLAGEDCLVRVRGIQVVRHKPGRRCLIEYDVRVEQPERLDDERLLGKVRARRFGNAGYELADALWRAGFTDASDDGISVPEPIATIADFRMWLQRKAPGRTATDLLPGPDGPRLARRIAEAAHKLHRAGVPAGRTHTIGDELRILDDCLARVAWKRPRLADRIARLRAACERLAERIPRAPALPIHRDFYGDQVIVDGERLYLVDLDLYCKGDSALDVGNFLGHLTEQALRTFGDPAALAAVEGELEDRFCELAGEEVRSAVRTYATLTLARHVYLSTLLPERRSLTAPLLALCEERLSAPRPRCAAPLESPFAHVPEAENFARPQEDCAYSPASPSSAPSFSCASLPSASVSAPRMP